MLFIVVIGPSGCGKTTIASLLSKRTGMTFFDADDFHSEENVKKMTTGTALNDADRLHWLDRLQRLIQKQVNQKQNSTLACSALKKSYREKLRSASPENVRFVYLEASKQLLEKRLEERMRNSEHFMPKTLLNSQLSTLEIPDNAVSIAAELAPEKIVEVIIQSFPDLSTLPS